MDVQSLWIKAKHLLLEKPINIKEYEEGNGGVLAFDHFVPFKNSVTRNSFAGSFFNLIINPDASIIEFDASGKVTRINFTSKEVDKLFNAADLDAQSFAKTFIDNYPIPELSPFIYYPNLHSYNDALGYTSDKGFKVIITQDKHLIIEKVASKNERKFD